MKVRPVGAELFSADGRTDGQTDMMKIIVAFRDLANEPRNSLETKNGLFERNVIRRPAVSETWRDGTVFVLSASCIAVSSAKSG